MNRLQLLLGKLTEEALEVGKEALKAQQFGLDSDETDDGLTNKQRLHKEINDFNTIVQMLNEEFDFDYNPNQDEIDQKKKKVNKYAKKSYQLGLVDK